MAKKPAKTKAASKDQLSQRKLDELMGVLLILLGVMLTIAFVTYHPDDLPKEARPGMVHNSLGLVGVWLSWYLIHLTIGYPIVVMPLLIVAWGVCRLLGKETSGLRRWTIFILLIAFYVALSGAIYSMIVSE
ncbi:MAG TPA: DNA translocase FtsK 4TM domain-containing protein, partial [bacterium]|nr:DNA translocase FtsK 4TM domain-containing protein [bacterium]